MCDDGAIEAMERQVQGVEAHLHVSLTRFDQRLREHEGELRRWVERSVAEGLKGGHRQGQLTGPTEKADVGGPSSEQNRLMDKTDDERLRVGLAEKADGEGRRRDLMGGAGMGGLDGAATGRRRPIAPGGLLASLMQAHADGSARREGWRETGRRRGPMG